MGVHSQHLFSSPSETHHQLMMPANGYIENRAVLDVQELQGVVSRAALQSPEAAQQLPEEVFWFARPPKDLLKWNLLSPGAFPWLKPFLRRHAHPALLSKCLR